MTYTLPQGRRKLINVAEEMVLSRQISVKIKPFRNSSKTNVTLLAKSPLANCGIYFDVSAGTLTLQITHNGI